MDLIEKTRDAVVHAGTTFSEDRLRAYKRALEIEEGNDNALWALEQMIANSSVAAREGFPLCDDTGIPHVLLEIGEGRELDPNFFKDIERGIAEGLSKLPGRPMAVRDNDIEQKNGLYEESSMVRPVSFLIESDDGSTYSGAVDDDEINVHVLLQGGGPEIRARTYRVYHKRSRDIVFGQAISWLEDSLQMLGCTPSIPAIGIGRSHFEATSLMLRAMVHGSLDKQSDIEKYVTSELNKTNIGPLGLGGKTTVLGSFVNIGPQRASGVRIVAVRPSCFVEPRVASFKI